MEQKTYRYFILQTLLTSILLMVVSPSFGQTNQNVNTVPTETVPLYNGISIGTDLYGLGSKLLGGDFLTAEVSVEANLKNRFFPIAELGFGTTDTWSDQGTHYKSSSPYFKLGVNYNTMYKKNNPGHLYVGLRYAFSPISFDVTSTNDEGIIGNSELHDDIWGVYPPAFNHQGLKATMHWFELVCGVKVHIYKQIHMGWSLRMRYRISSSPSEYGDPWFVPGFGTYDSSNMGLTYSLIYKLPF